MKVCFIKKMLFLVFASQLLFMQSWADNPFKLMSSTNMQQRISVNGTFTDSRSLVIEKQDQPVSGFALSGYVVQPSTSGFVRVLLETDDGKKFVVMESCRLYHDVDTLMLHDYCEETIALESGLPTRLHVYVKDAVLHIDDIIIEKEADSQLRETRKIESARQRNLQTADKARSINLYNSTHHKLWVAGETPLSQMSWEDKKRVLGIDSDDVETGGLEYYIGGVFDIGNEGPISPMRDVTSYSEAYDWRDRHNQNWITSCKDQGGSGMCTMFTGAALTEALVNLYYNQHIDMDLSEVCVARYMPGRTASNWYNTGSYNSNVINYIVNSGIIDEETLPFLNDPNQTLPSTRPVGNECVKLADYHSLYTYGFTTQSDLDTIKHLILTYGPVASGFHTRNMHHAMLLVGWGTIHEGDDINTIQNNDFYGNTVVQPGNPNIGKNYWIFKNSYGVDDGHHHEGYMYMLFNDVSCFSTVVYADLPVECLSYTDDDIVCEDADGDGYYNWGLGPKPANAPTWIPDEPDGDDSDPSKGPMDEYGYLLDFDSQSADTLYLTTTTVWNAAFSLKRPVVVEDSVLLSVRDTVNMCGNSVIILRQGAEISVNGGDLRNALIRPEGTTASMVRVINGGVIRTRRNEETNISSPQTLYMDDGEIY